MDKDESQVGRYVHERVEREEQKDLMKRAEKELHCTCDLYFQSLQRISVTRLKNNQFLLIRTLVLKIEIQVEYFS